MSPRHPYVGLPDRQIWRTDPGIEAPEAFDPVSDVPFAITPQDRVVTAGSCFAQHLGHRLAGAGFGFHVTEPVHPMIPEEIGRRYGYGLFSARYGNVYTPRQLLQLWQRAYGLFVPKAEAWPLAPDGAGPRVVDPFRPRIQPEGFVSEAELAADREVHLAAVRRAVEEADVFAFTLGLTEAWEDARDGAVFPIAPGVAGGRWTPGEVRFRNFDVAETEADLMAALEFLRARNPDVRIVLTVSPVPLAATYEDRHVAVSTALSKAVLRVAAESARARLAGCAYFPSFEIITSPHTRARYYEPDRREVRHAGVTHVMRLFLRHFGGVEDLEATAKAARRAKRRAEREGPAGEARTHMERMERGLEAICDESAIDNR